MPKEKMATQRILMVCVLLLLVANILLTAKTVLDLERLKSCEHGRESLPCQAVPIRFVMDEPECADKLLRSMNVTNIHILPSGVPDFPQVGRNLSERP